MEGFAPCSGDSWCSWRVADIKYEASFLAQVLCNEFQKQVFVVVCFCCWLWNWAAPPKQSFHFWHHFDPRCTFVVSLLKYKPASTFIVCLHTTAVISLLLISSKRHLVSLIALFASGTTFGLFSLHYLWLPCLAPSTHEVCYQVGRFPKLLDGKIRKSPLNLASGPDKGKNAAINETEWKQCKHPKVWHISLALKKTTVGHFVHTVIKCVFAVWMMRLTQKSLFKGELVEAWIHCWYTGCNAKLITPQSAAVTTIQTHM